VCPASCQDLVKARQLRAGSSFWSTAVDQVLLALVDADSQVGPHGLTTSAGGPAVEL